ncbi:periplasmic protease [Streptomyces viridochromogenes DSM 40736]|uniref:Periplasmic protease n=1 Tax=Streptomyces viridochromogenes (strain DSM 40736 / JCM 4977 / BCRC 1201 / Tue 494) TaxID=591159 RepID=D9XE78_STRVT|nr:periplasmic protease [Streptomyces viridochromogenes DSM 40736]
MYRDEEGKHSGKRSHSPHSEVSGRYRSDRNAGYRGSGPDHGKTP